MSVASELVAHVPCALMSRLSPATGLALVTLAACASPHSAEFTRAMRAADDAEGKGQYLEAAKRFDAAAASTTRLVDQDEARVSAARMLARGGDRRGALARFDALAGAIPPGPEACSAAYESALLRVDGEEPEVGWRGMDAMLHRCPNGGEARPAMRHLLAHKDEAEGPPATLVYLRRLQKELGGTDRAEGIAYEIALRLERTGDPRGARDAFMAMAARWPYPDGSLWDDALFHASLIDESTGHPADAVADLQQMLSRREHAIISGSAERPRYEPAQLRIAELYRDRLGDRAHAEEAFHTLFAKFPDCPFRDRGLYEEAAMLRADGKVDAACERLGTLVKEVPDSRYVPCALQQCPGIRARPGPNAPKMCHPYIHRELADASPPQPAP
jgi:tetratricopeptide (TPR) repeat protein